MCSENIMDSWSELPPEILEEVIKILLRRDNLTHFGAVCKSWHSVCKSWLSSRVPKDFPLALCHPQPYGAPILLLSCPPNSDSRKYACSRDETVDQRIFLPEAANKWICGSSLGWSVIVGFRGAEVFLLNPLTRGHIQLPSFENSFYEIKKAVISLDPTYCPNECVVMAIGRKSLWFCKLGDKEWTKVEDCAVDIHDIVYYQERFYAVTEDGSLISYCGKDPNAEIDIDKIKTYPIQILRDGASRVCRSKQCFKRYLVVSSSNLLQVLRIYEDKLFIRKSRCLNVNGEPKIRSCMMTNTQGFEVHILVESRSLSPITKDFVTSWTPNYEWLSLRSLPNRSLFLGYNASLSVPASLSPDRMGNHIYFTEEHHQMHCLFPPNSSELALHGVSVFNLEDESFANYDQPDASVDRMPPIWFTPNPW